MNERERFRRVFCLEPVDRPPLLEEGVREEVLDLWRAQGMPAGQTHLELFGLTPHENVGPDLRFRPDFFGRVMSLSAQEYRRAFDVALDRFPDDWKQTAARLADRDHIACIWACRGFFQALGVGDWNTLREALLGVLKQPREVRDRLEMYGEFCARMLETALGDVTPDFLYLGEPISDRNGPLISPEMFETFMIPAYERIVEVARRHHVEAVLVSTYGNTAPLLPVLMRAGVNMLWVSEADEIPEMDYRTLRQRHGTALGLVGGIPLEVLRLDSAEEMNRRLAEIVSPLLRSGRYIPLAGGRVREDIPWRCYKRYRKELSELIA